MRLIDADEVIEYINRTPLSESAKGTIYNLIANQPTAYDVRKVVEQLEEYSTPEIINTIAGKKVVKVKEGGINDTREQEDVLSRK